MKLVAHNVKFSGKEVTSDVFFLVSLCIKERS